MYHLAGFGEAGETIDILGEATRTPGSNPARPASEVVSVSPRRDFRPTDPGSLSSPHRRTFHVCNVRARVMKTPFEHSGDADSNHEFQNEHFSMGRGSYRGGAYS